MTTITAKVITDSECEEYRLTSMQLTYPRVIHAEFMTHRMFSRNAASSRAIPVKRMIEAVRNDPFIPLVWGKNVAGMQSKEELTGPFLWRAQHEWLEAMNDALFHAENMADLDWESVDDGPTIGVHKQIINRLLEPFSHITVLVTSTTWDNFFKQRIHPDAEPHIKMLAEAMKIALDTSRPEQLEKVEVLENNAFLYLSNCHTPYLDNLEKYRLINRWLAGEDPKQAIRKVLNLSVARCASTSYSTVEGTQMTLEKSEEIVKKLLGSDVLHASPFEHVAFPDPSGNFRGHWRNFQGFAQYRGIIEAEMKEAA